MRTFALYVFSWLSNVMCVCLLSVACELCVDVGFNCDECFWGLDLNVSLVNVGVAFECCVWFWGWSTSCVRWGFECEFSGCVGFGGEFFVNVDVVFSLASKARCVCCL